MRRRNMISNQILQNTIDGLKEITRVDMCVFDTEGKVLSYTFKAENVDAQDIASFAASPADSQEIHGYQFFKIQDDDGQMEYVLVINGGTEDAYMVGKIAAFQIQSLLVAYKERFDKDNFIKNLILDNLLLVDIFNRAKKLHINTDVRRSVFLVEAEGETNTTVLEMMRDYFISAPADFVTAVDEKNVIVVHEMAEEDAAAENRDLAEGMLEHLNKEGEGKVRISYGTTVDDIKDVSRSYKEAKMALDVGKIFFEERNVVAYSSLGIGRLIYQLPIPLCRMFIQEIFEGKSPEEFDNETLATINKFFENSLNVSETSRQLYIHRNTLVYRLDKLQKTTGLDLRIFEDAITFKIALMVAKYMKYMEDTNY